MDILEAIETLEDLLSRQYEDTPDTSIQAVRLGLEALSRVQESRTPQSINPHLPLPTEDEPIHNTSAEAYLKHLKESPLGRESGA